MIALASKSDAAAKIKEWKFVAENQSKTKPLKLQSDDGGEFTSRVFQSWLAQHGVAVATLNYRLGNFGLLVGMRP